MEKHGGNPLPPDVLDAIRENGVALKGPITTPVGGGFRSVNVALRKELDLYAQVRPCKSLPRRAHALRRRRPDHRPREHRGPLRRHRVRAGHARRRGADRAGSSRTAASSAATTPGISIKPISITGTRRIFEFAFDYARKNGRQQDHGRPQGEHHEVHRRPLAARRARGRRGEPRHRVRRPDRGQHVHAARPAAGGVRRARAAEPLRRHPLRPRAPG